MKQSLAAFVPGILILALAIFPGCGKSGTSDVRINAGGSSFVYPLMSTWASEYEKKTGAKINYQSIGSGAGIQQMTARTLDFGCSDAPMNDEQLQKAREVGGEVVHIPLIMGAVVPIYNVEGIDKPLRFSGEVLSDIFLEKIKKWNDPKLAELNPGVNLPAKDILTVHRSDGSGTTFIFADYLTKVSPEWKEKVGVATSVKWPGGVGAKGNEGVAGKVAQSPGSIGYVEITYALQNNIKFGHMKNKEGEFIEPTLESVTAAARSALKDIPEDLRYSLTDAAGKGSYPLSGTAWAILYVNQPADKGKAIVSFLRWVTHEGQENAKALDYARLPDELVKRVEQKLEQVNVGK